MATKNKPVLGYRHCPDCGQRATIHQAGGRRGSLYQRCGCGCVQSNGPLIQSRMYYETEWLDGLKPASPPDRVMDLASYQAARITNAALIPLNPVNAGQNDREKPSDSAKKDEDNAGQQTDFRPGEATAGAADNNAKPTTKKGLVLVLLAGAGVALAAILRRSA